MAILKSLLIKLIWRSWKEKEKKRFCDLYTAVMTFHYTVLFQQFGEAIEICFISQCSRWDWFKHILFMTEHEKRIGQSKKATQMRFKPPS